MPLPNLSSQLAALRRRVSADERHVSAGAAVRRGFLWNAANFLVSQGLGLVIFLILSHQLSPAVFGAFALAAIVVDLFYINGRWSAIDAILQRKDFSPEALSTAFWTLLMASIAIVAIISLSANEIAYLLQAPQEKNLLPALSAVLLLTPASAVMESILLRTLRFRAHVLHLMIGTVGGAIAGLLVVFGPTPEWALVAQRMGAGIASIAALVAITRWRPTFVYVGAMASGFALRTARLWVAMMLAGFHTRVMEAFIGVRDGVASLGQLRLAQRFSDTLHGPVTSPVQGLWVPILAGVRDNHAESWRLFVNLTRFAVFLAAPCFAGLALISKDLVILTLDDRYLKAADLLFVIAISSVLTPLGYFSSQIFAALDRTDLALKVSAVLTLAMIPIAWVASGFGALAVLIAWAVLGGVTGLVVTVWQIRLLGGSVREFAAAIAPPYIAATVMFVSVTLFSMWLPIEDPLLRLLLQTALGATVYTIWLLVVHGSSVKSTHGFLTEIRERPREPSSAPPEAEAPAQA